MSELFTAVEAPYAAKSGRRRWLTVAIAALAISALVVVNVRTTQSDGRAAMAEKETGGKQLSLRQMLAQSLRLQEEGRHNPTFYFPAYGADRTEDMEQRETSGPHALDWRKGQGESEEAPRAEVRREYVPPPGPIDRVDDPVGDEDGWVQIGDRGFRVTRDADGALDRLDVPGDSTVRPVVDGWEVNIPDAQERDRYNERYKMRRGDHLRRSHFTDKQWAANRLERKFYTASVDKSSRRDPAWQETPREMDRAGWTADNSKMQVRTGVGAGEDWSAGDTGDRDRYYHWVTEDGRTDTDAPGYESPRYKRARHEVDAPMKDGMAAMRAGERDAAMIAEADTGNDRKPSWLVIRPTIKDGSIKVVRDASGAVKHVVVPVSAMVSPKGAGTWKISFPQRDARSQEHRADTSSAARAGAQMSWDSVSAPGDTPGEDAKVKRVAGRNRGLLDDAADVASGEVDGQNIDRAAYGIPERQPPLALPDSAVREDGKMPVHTKRDAMATSVQVWGGWEPKRKPITDVYAPNEDPFYCMDGSEASLCGTTARPESRHDFTLGWDGEAKAQRALAREESRDRAGELGEHVRGDRREVRDRKPDSGYRFVQSKGYRETPASSDPYRYIRDGNYAKILQHEDEVTWRSNRGGREEGGHRVEMSAGNQRRDAEEMKEAAQVEHSMESMRDVTRPDVRERGAQQEGHALAIPQERKPMSRPYDQRTAIDTPRNLPYKVRAPYDGSLRRIGYPNMRGGMRGEDGALMPYDDRSGTGNLVAKDTHKDWASDVWARPSPWGVRDVRDSLNRNEEGGARRLVDEGGFHEYEAGNKGFHEERPGDPHDDDDSAESEHLRVDQFDVVGDEEGRRRAARGGDGNAEEFDSSRRAAKSDYDVDVVPEQERVPGGDTRHVYMPFRSDKTAWGVTDLASRRKERAASRIAERISRRSQARDSKEVEAMPANAEQEGTDEGELSHKKIDLTGAIEMEREREREGEGIRSDEAQSSRFRTETQSLLAQEEQREEESDVERRKFRSEKQLLLDNEKLAEDKFQRQKEQRERELRRRMRESAEDAARDGTLEDLSQRPGGAEGKGVEQRLAEQRIDALAAARLTAQAERRKTHVASDAERRAAEHVNEVAARKLAAEARLVRRHGSSGARPAAQKGGGGTISKLTKHVKTWLGVYEAHPKPQKRVSLSDGVDAVDHYNHKALEHILSSAHGGDSAARLTARQAVAVLKKVERPQQLALQRSLVRSSSLRSSLSNYLDDYGSGPEDAAAANGINL